MKFEMHEKIKLSNEEQSFKNLASLDLQPIVKVYENKEEVEVTGYLVLSGEFIIKNQYWEEQLDQFDALHYDALHNNDYKVDSFQHQIPLSIRIDNSRVEDISTVVVEVDNFDYQIISNQEIEIISEIKLHGVKPDKREPEVLKMLDEQYEIKTQEDTQEQTQEQIQNIDQNDKNINEYDNKFTNPIYSLLKKEQKDFKDLLQTDCNDSKNNDDENNNIVEEENENENEHLTNINSNEEFPVAKVTIDKGEDKSKDDSEINDSNMLYGLLKGDEIQRYKMKIYLVQKDDTIEKIADKYGINSEDIFSNNNIESNNELQLGQLLYLPNTR